MKRPAFLGFLFSFLVLMDVCVPFNHSRNVNKAISFKLFATYFSQADKTELILSSFKGDIIKHGKYRKM